MVIARPRRKARREQNPAHRPARSRLLFRVGRENRGCFGCFGLFGFFGAFGAFVSVGTVSSFGAFVSVGTVSSSGFSVSATSFPVAQRAPALCLLADRCRRRLFRLPGGGGGHKSSGQVTPAPTFRVCVDFEGWGRQNTCSEPDDECNTFPHGKDKGPCTHRKPANISSNWSSITD